MPRKKQAQPKHCQEEADNTSAAEAAKTEVGYYSNPRDSISHENVSVNISDAAPEQDEDLASYKDHETSLADQRCTPESETKQQDNQDSLYSGAMEMPESDWTDKDKPSSDGKQTSTRNKYFLNSRKSPDLRLPALLPELVHRIKKEPFDLANESNYDDKHDDKEDNSIVEGERPLFSQCFQRYPQHGGEEEDAEREFKYRPPSSQRQNPQHMECDDVSNGFSSPRSKATSPYRPRSNSSERSINAVGFASQRSSSSSFSSSSSSSRTATSPSYTTESHVNRLQSFVESLTTPVAAVRSKLVKDGRHLMQSPSTSSTTSKMQSTCRDSYRGYKCCSAKTSLLSCYRASGGPFTNPLASNSYGQVEPTEDQPLDLSVKKYHQPHGDRGSYDSDAMDGALSGSASLLTLQSKFGENSPMLANSNSKFQGVNFYNNLGYSYFKQSMYDTSKAKSYPQGSSNGFDARSPSLTSSSSSKPVTSEISSLKQMVTSCETGRPSSQTKLSGCCDPNRLPMKRPRSGTNERSAETSGDKSLVPQQSQPLQQVQHSLDSKKSKVSLQDRRLEKLQKKKLQNFNSMRSDGSLQNDASSLTTSETNHQVVAEKKKVHTNQRCSCGVTYSNLFQLTVHVEETGHTPESLELDTAEDLPKLVRGQDVWISQGQEQTEMILRCIQCRTSFRSLPELTVHMVKTKHYINIVKADGDFSDPNNRTWMPKTTASTDQQKPSSSSSSLSSAHTPTTMSSSNAGNNNISPASFKSGSQMGMPDKKQAEINHKPKNKASDNENSNDKTKSDGKNSLKFGITEMLDFPSYKKMLKKMTENCEEIRPVDGAALSMFRNRVDQEKSSKQIVKNDSSKYPSHHQMQSGRTYHEEATLQKFESRGSRNVVKPPPLSKPSYQSDTVISKALSSLSDKYLAPRFSFSADKNRSPGHDSEGGENKTTAADLKSLQLVAPLPYGVDGASSLKAMENFIESSFSKISQSLHTPSSLPFPSFASRCLITAPVLENVYNNAFLREARASSRNANPNSNNNKSDFKKRPLDQCQSSTNEDLLRKRKKLQSKSSLYDQPQPSFMAISQVTSQTSMDTSAIKSELISAEDRNESRFTISSDSSSTTDESEHVKQYRAFDKHQPVQIKDKRTSDVGEQGEGRSLNSFDQRNEKYLLNFSGIAEHGESGAPSQNPISSYSNSLDSIKMLASKFFTSDDNPRRFESSPGPVGYLNKNRDYCPDSKRMEYLIRHNLTQNSVVAEAYGKYGHGSLYAPSPSHVYPDPPNLIRIKPEPEDQDDERSKEGADISGENRIRQGNSGWSDRVENDAVKDKSEHLKHQLEQGHAKGSEKGEHCAKVATVNGINSKPVESGSRLGFEAEGKKDDAGIDIGCQSLDETNAEQQCEGQASSNSLHLTRCQPSTFPIIESLSNNVRSCQQVQ